MRCPTAIHILTSLSGVRTDSSDAGSDAGWRDTTASAAPEADRPGDRGGCPMTRRRIENQIDALSDELAAGTDGAPADLTVTWREAAPDARPEGRAYDPESGEFTYDLWGAQRDCLDALKRESTDLVAFLAGYGTGKTVLGARWTIANALAHPGSHFLVMGQIFSKARDSTFLTLFEQLPGERTAVRTGSFNGPEESPIVADYNRSRHRLTLTNDTVITLGSADSWSRFAGAEFGGIWLDEPSHYETDLHELLAMLGSRLRGTAGPKM